MDDWKMIVSLQMAFLWLISGGDPNHLLNVMILQVYKDPFFHHPTKTWPFITQDQMALEILEVADGLVKAGNVAETGGGWFHGGTLSGVKGTKQKTWGPCFWGWVLKKGVGFDFCLGFCFACVKVWF